MKIVTKSNFDEDIYKERVVAENVNTVFAQEMIDLWNDKNGDHSDDYLVLVEDDYVLYDGYQQLL